MIVKMDLLNFHTHRPAVLGERVVRSLDLCSECGLFDITSSQNELFSVGIHPWSVCQAVDLNASLERLQNLLVLPEVCMLGECGLDKCCRTEFDLQLLFFRAQVELAESMGKPVVIHCVRAYDVLLSVRRASTFRQPWIIHGFRGKVALMEQLLRMGFYFSFGPYFQEDTLRVCPEDRFFIETDDFADSLLSVYQHVALVRNMSVETLIELQQERFSFLCLNRQFF